MEWGSGITSLGSTALKGRQVTFGIKDEDRLKHLCVLGRAHSGRAEFVSRMAFQDIDRGMGVVILDAKGNLAPFMLERFGKEMEDRLIYLEPAEAEYPYSWNSMDDVRALPQAAREAALAALITSVYQLDSDVLATLAAPALLEKRDATLVTFYHLVFDEKIRAEVFGEGEALRMFEEALTAHTDVVDAVEEHGRYIARDTLVRNLVGQPESKFSLTDLTRGKVVIVNLEKIRMFPTRMTPLVRTFALAAQMAGTNHGHPVALYLHDTLRHLSTTTIEQLFGGRQVALTVSDTVIQESDRERREHALSRCGSIVSFAAHTLDRPLIERAFYPYIDPEELEELDARQFAIALTVDGVRTSAFFGTALPTERQRTSSYQDLAALCRQRYTTARTTVDQLFTSDDDSRRGPKKPPGFQDAFKAMFEKRAQAAKQPGGAPQKESGTKKEASESKSTPAQTQNTPLSRSREEVPEDLLKRMLYVPSVS